MITAKNGAVSLALTEKMDLEFCNAICGTYNGGNCHNCPPIDEENAVNCDNNSDEE